MRSLNSSISLWTAAWLPLWLMGLAGCSGSPPVPPSQAPAGAPAGAASSPPSTTTTTTIQPPSLDSQTSPSPVPSRAEAAFARLTADGIPLETWEAAYAELESLGAEAAGVLKRGLTSDRSIVREWSASILAANWEAAALAVPELTAAVAAPADNANQAIRANAAAALVLVPGEEGRAVPVLLELLHSPDVGLRTIAVVSFRNLGASAASHFEALQPVLDDPNPDIVRHVVELLGQFGEVARPALPRLKQLAQSPGETPLQSAARQAILAIEGGAPANP